MNIVATYLARIPEPWRSGELRKIRDAARMAERYRPPMSPAESFRDMAERGLLMFSEDAMDIIVLAESRGK